MKKWFAFAFVAAVLVGCANKPIYNVDEHPIPVTAQSYPSSRVEAIIIQAGQRTNWRFQRIGEGHLVATQFSDARYSATIDIYFNQQSYRITHVSSVGLKEKDGTIHPRYNRWISALEREIEIQLRTSAVLFQPAG
jgi:hypothetical protein